MTKTKTINVKVAGKRDVIDLLDNAAPDPSILYTIQTLGGFGGAGCVYCIKIQDYKIEHLGIVAHFHNPAIFISLRRWAMYPGGGKWRHPHEVGTIAENMLHQAGVFEFYPFCAGRVLRRLMDGMHHDPFYPNTYESALSMVPSVYSAALSCLTSVNPKDFGNRQMDNAGNCPVCGESGRRKSRCSCGNVGCTGECVRESEVYNRTACSECSEEYCPDCGERIKDGEEIRRCEKCNSALCGCNYAWYCNDMCLNCWDKEN